jgi:hypothetical protein
LFDAALALKLASLGAQNVISAKGGVDDDVEVDVEVDVNDDTHSNLAESHTAFGSHWLSQPAS